MTATHTHTQHIRVMRVMCLMASVNNTRSMLAFVSLYSANAESRIPDSLVKSSAWSYLKRSNKRGFMKVKGSFQCELRCRSVHISRHLLVNGVLYL